MIIGSKLQNKCSKFKKRPSPASSVDVMTLQHTPQAQCDIHGQQTVVGRRYQSSFMSLRLFLSPFFRLFGRVATPTKKARLTFEASTTIEYVTLLFYLTSYRRFSHALSNITVHEQGIIQTLLQEREREKNKRSSSFQEPR